MIINDPGGNVFQHAFDFAVLAAQGVMFEIVYCASACVMALIAVPKEQVCFYPSAWIGYHTAAKHPDEQGRCCVESPTTMRWERGRDLINRGYNQCEQHGK